MHVSLVLGLDVKMSKHNNIRKIISKNQPTGLDVGGMIFRSNFFKSNFNKEFD